MPSRNVHFPVDDRPTVLVRHSDERWYPGRLHAWLHDDPAARDGRATVAHWLAVVSYHVGAGMQFYLCLDAARVRPSDRGSGTGADADRPAGTPR